MLVLSLKQKILSFLTQVHILNTHCSMWKNSISITYKYHDFFPHPPYYRLSKGIDSVCGIKQYPSVASGEATLLTHLLLLSVCFPLLTRLGSLTYEDMPICTPIGQHSIIGTQ